MEQMILFFQQYGWQLAIIAFVGIVILGVLKYANVFSKIEKEKRKPIYFAISMGFSLIATAIYLLVVKQFEINYFIAIASAVYALNQAMYAVYETTGLRDLLCKVVELIIQKIKKRKDEESENLSEGN